MKVEKVSVETILPLRRDVLRPGFTLEQSRFEGDLWTETFHLAIVEKDEVLACATFIPEISKEFSAKNQYRLRGMAVAGKAQNRGLGKAVFQEGEKLLQLKNMDLLWFNARKEAVDFYLKQHCRVRGDEFDISDVGPHFLMFKKLK